MSIKNKLKGTVQRDLRGVENRLKLVTEKLCDPQGFYLISKGHHHESSIEPVSASSKQFNQPCLVELT
jgi:hypothetical protein